MHLESRVDNVDKSDPDSKWSMPNKRKYRDIVEKIFVFLVVSNDHFCTPVLPEGIIGINYWVKNNHAFHFKDFQIVFFGKNKTVIFVGHGNSGQDIITQLLTVARKIYNSVTDKDVGDMIKGLVSTDGTVEILPRIKRAYFSTRNVKLIDGLILNDINYNVYATGFHYNISFLGPGVTENLQRNSKKISSRIHNLWKQLFI